MATTVGYKLHEEGDDDFQKIQLIIGAPLLTAAFARFISEYADTMTKYRAGMSAEIQETNKVKSKYKYLAKCDPALLHRYWHGQQQRTFSPYTMPNHRSSFTPRPHKRKMP